jgi:hypothetical protein
MAKQYKFEKDYTHIVRDPKSGAVTGHVAYPAGHEGLVKDDHIEGAEAEKSGRRLPNSGRALPGPTSEGARDADAPGGSHDVH